MSVLLAATAGAGLSVLLAATAVSNVSSGSSSNSNAAFLVASHNTTICPGAFIVWRSWTAWRAFLAFLPFKVARHPQLPKKRPTLPTSHAWFLSADPVWTVAPPASVKMGCALSLYKPATAVSGSESSASELANSPSEEATESPGNDVPASLSLASLSSLCTSKSMTSGISATAGRLGTSSLSFTFQVTSRLGHLFVGICAEPRGKGAARASSSRKRCVQSISVERACKRGTGRARGRESAREGGIGRERLTLREGKSERVGGKEGGRESEGVIERKGGS